MVWNNGRLEEPVSFPKDDSEWHSFLDGHFEDALTIRRYVEDLPETAATFTLSRIQDDLNAYHPNLPKSVVKLTGAWPKPEELTGDTTAQKWVNPNYVHSYHYSDCITHCECGAPIIRQRYGTNEKVPTYHEHHADSCPKYQRLESRARVLRNRANVLEDLYMHGHNLHRGRSRLGYSDGHNNLGWNEVHDWGVDLTQLYIDGRKRLARTILVLLREHKTSDVAELYGVSKASIQKIMREETVGDSKIMYRIRRANTASTH